MAGGMHGGMQGHEGEREVQTDRLPPPPPVQLSGTEGSTVAALPFPPAQHVETSNTPPSNSTVFCCCCCLSTVYPPSRSKK